MVSYDHPFRELIAELSGIITQSEIANDPMITGIALDSRHVQPGNIFVALSGGQQQRLCLARSLVLQPEVILLDEPTSGLDPISTGKVESSLQELKLLYTIVLVPHSIQQAARVADYAAFFLQGELVEYAPGKEIFTKPQDKRAEDYIEGRFG